MKFFESNLNKRFNEVMVLTYFSMHRMCSVSIFSWLQNASLKSDISKIFLKHYE